MLTDTTAALKTTNLANFENARLISKFGDMDSQLYGQCSRTWYSGSFTVFSAIASSLHN